MSRLVTALIMICLSGICLHLYLANRALAQELSSALEKTSSYSSHVVNQAVLFDAKETKQHKTSVKCPTQLDEKIEASDTHLDSLEAQITFVESQLDDAATQIHIALNQAQTEREITHLLNTLKNIDRVDLPNDALQHVLENAHTMAVDVQLYVLDFIEGSLTHENAYLLTHYLHHPDYTVAYEAFTRLKELDKHSDVRQLLVRVSEQAEHQAIRQEANHVLFTINQSAF